VHATFWNIEAGFKEGLPFTPWGAEIRRQRMAGNSKDNPDAACLPLEHMQLHTHSQPRKIVQSWRKSMARGDIVGSTSGAGKRSGSC
jgi:hypothetical protein